MTGSPELVVSGALESMISDAVSRLYLDKFGKGPSAARTYINGNVVTTVLEDILTGAERALVAKGRIDTVLTTRMLWQDATDASFKAVVGEVTGRRAITVISGFEVVDEVATEVFILDADPR